MMHLNETSLYSQYLYCMLQTSDYSLLINYTLYVSYSFQTCHIKKWHLQNFQNN